MLRLHVTDVVPEGAVYIISRVGFDKRGRLRVSGRKIILSDNKDTNV